MMLEELERRNYSAGTTRRYLRFVERFAQHFGKSPDKLGPDHLRSYQAYLLRERKLCPGTVENHVAALRFFFVRTLHRHQFREYLPYPKTRKKLPNILSREEVARLINASSSLFQRTLLMVLYGTGMRRSELARLKIDHIDSQRMIIHVVDGKGHKDRDLPLSPTLLENLRVYWRQLKPRSDDTLNRILKSPHRRARYRQLNVVHHQRRNTSPRNHSPEVQIIFNIHNPSQDHRHRSACAFLLTS
jgi:integrase